MLRPLRESDSEAVVACYRSAYGDERQIDAETIVGWCRNPEFKPDWMQVLELDDEVVGYGDIWIGDEEAELDLAAPGHWETFLDWGESRGRSAGVARMRATFPVPHELQQVVAARGIDSGGRRTRGRASVTTPRPRLPFFRTRSSCVDTSRPTRRLCAPP